MISEQVVILTTDRYWPWNGSHVERDDRIWGALNTALELPFLVYQERRRPISANVEPDARYVYGYQRSWRVCLYAASAVFRSVARAIRYRNSRFLLFSLRRRVLPGLVWYWSYAQLRNYLSRQNIGVVIFHGEFNAWGRSVAWACQDAGVSAVAWQHGVGGPVPTARPRRYDERLPLPKYLIVWSEFALSQRNESLARHVRGSIGGTLRFGSASSVLPATRSKKILLCPSTSDFSGFLGLANDDDLFPEYAHVVLRVHPLRAVPNSVHVKLQMDHDDLARSLGDCGAVVAGVSSIVVDALLREIPVVVPLFLRGVQNSPFAQKRPGIYPCASREEMRDALRLVTGDANTTRAEYHATAHYFAETLDADRVRSVLEEVSSG